MRPRPSIRLAAAVFSAGILGVSLSATPFGVAATKKQPAATATPINRGTTGSGRVGGSAAQSVVRSGPMLDVKSDLLGGRPILRQVPLSTVSGEQAVNSGGKALSYGQLADAALIVARSRRDHLRSARAGLLNDPVMTEELVETDLAAVLISTTNFTVVDPGAVRSSAPEVMRRSATGMSTAQLNPAQRKAFEAFKTSLGSKPNGHPLKEAMAKGDDALVAALAEGKGDQTITTRVRFEKQAAAVKGLVTAQIRSGPISAPSQTAALGIGGKPTAAPAGALPTGSTKTKGAKTGSVKAGTADAGAAQSGSVKGSGKAGQGKRRAAITGLLPSLHSSLLNSLPMGKSPKAVPGNVTAVTVPKVAVTTTAPPIAATTCCDQSDGASMLAGFTIGDDLGWSETINLGVGEFTVGAAAEYSVGLRIPMKIDAVLTPSVMVNTTDNTGDHSYDVALSANLFDANADYYRSVGLSEADVKDGKELVVFGDVYVFVEGNVLGIPFDGRFPEKPLLDFGQNFAPPYGACGTSCSFDVWIPAAITHTSINVVGIVSGSGQIGFAISGAGTVAVDYESLVDGKVVPSTLGVAGALLAKNRWSSDGVGFVPKMKTEITPAGGAASKSFGYTFSNPSYTWDIVATPEVKAEAGFNLLLFKDDFTFGPYTIGALSLGLGSLVLGAHAGTPDSFTNNAGQYTESCTKIRALCDSGLIIAAEGNANPAATTAPKREAVAAPGEVITPTTTIRKRKDGAAVARPPKAAATIPGGSTPTTIKGRIAGGLAGARTRKVP
jgi:hypothetical protein